MLDRLLHDFWFENVNNFNIQNAANQCEESEMIEYIRQFQNGNFQSKKEFLNYFLYSTDRRVFVVGMRLFMAIADHTDFGLLEEFLSICDEEQLRVFLAFVEESLSLHSIPYLLALCEEWEDTYVENDIVRCILGMLGQEYYQEEKYDIEQIGESFVEFAGKHDLNKYYYNGEEYFSGNLTKLIIPIAMDCHHKNKVFYFDQISSILSNSSGIECPVSDGVTVDDSKVKELYDYVLSISKMEQQKGEKYFYGFKVS